eukprot:2233277-Pyramimonas_sp.AAC.1
MIEESLRKFSVAPCSPSACAAAAETRAVVVGGLKEYTFRATADWIRKLVTSLGVYKKHRDGEEFKVMAFCSLRVRSTRPWA